MVEKMNGYSLDIVKQNISRLKKIFPEVFCEDKIDFERLKEVLGEYIDDTDERYRFEWHGKSQAIRMAQTPSRGTLRPCKEEGKSWDTTQNLYIEGDNLEVLKLLQKSYQNEVKMIYIDPPYNTGNDFVYKDDYKDNLQNYLAITRQVDDEGNKTSTNSENSGRYHTNWLNMMYPRLKLARNLLKDDGVIFISIDDTEVANLRKICDEIFGEDNFICNICHKARASISNDKIISSNHNIILLYAKDYEVIFNERKIIGLDPDLSEFDNPDNDKRGPYRLTPVDGPGGAKKGNPYYKFMGIEGYFRYSKETMQKKYNEGLIVKTANGLQQKYYLEKAKKSRKTDTTWWDDAGLTSNATRNLIDLMGKKAFDTPKPVSLINRMLKLFTTFNKNAIILDFFSGSATTAHAVMQLNAADRGNRKFIMVQLPEQTDEKSDAFKSGYKNICEIGKERIRRAGDKIVVENKDKEGIENLDIGFKVFKLDSSNIKPWNPDFKDISNRLDEMVDNFVPERTEEDIVYEIMIKYGIDLTYPIEVREVSGKKVFSVGYGALIICLDNEITLDVVNGIVDLKNELNPEICRVVFKDNGFKKDSVKVNAVEILKRNNINEVMSV
ncbi:site-specific DNA-methyltransferase [Clostridium tyrobutyricum]|jgi:adenine-specific DNA-methyltransferase|uniref:site-specific DNA-methyltransferase n=2 Tax=Clostridium tyrobutyricum TaxID=1519 RepID=UPI0010AA145D|nr:site-specific DNA-methyltransferase [Clostridium tyrobutyricum]QCH29283.1 putative methyltransferase [Clostridium tyrobutyricum]